MIKCISQMHLPKPNSYCIAWSKQHHPLAFTWTQIKFICFKQGAFYTLSGKLLNFVDKFTYISSNISSIESDVNICLISAWTDINSFISKWKSDLSNKLNCSYVNNT